MTEKNSNSNSAVLTYIYGENYKEDIESNNISYTNDYDKKCKN